MAGRGASASSPKLPSASQVFEAFYEGWLRDQQKFLDQLIICMSNEDDDDVGKVEEVIEEVMSHYMRYFEEKAKAMARDDHCFLHFFSPPWLTALEKAFRWMGGFKPSLALTMVEASVPDMSPEQRRRVGAVRVEVEREEKEVEGVMGKVHEGIMRGAVESGGDVGGKEKVKGGMRVVMERADRVRREAVSKVVEGLSGPQTVKYLVAVGRYLLGMRTMGLNYM